MEPHVTPMPTPMSGWLEQAWLARYLDRQLTGEETAWFEAYVLDKPELLDVIDADTRLRDALAADRLALGSGDVSVTSSSQTSSTVSSSFPRKRESSAFSVHKVRRPTWLALAASVLLGLGVGSIGMRSFTTDRSADVVASPTRIIYDTMRGEATAPRVEHADGHSPYVLVEVAVPPGAENITLKVVGMADQALTPSPDGFVSFLVNRNQLDQPGMRSIEYRAGGTNKIAVIDLSITGKNER
jgi:hypothetical protein